MGTRFVVSLLALVLAGAAHAEQWTVDNGASRLTENGPDLTRYSRSIIGVSECKLDVAFNVRDLDKREKFRRKCYDLYDSGIRSQMIDVDSRILPSREKVEIKIRVEQNHFYIHPK